MALSTLVPLLIEAGPTLIRTVGSLFGSDGKKTADKAASLVESVTGAVEDHVHPKAAAQQLERKLYQLPESAQNTLLLMQTELERVKAEREKNRLLFERDIHRETQSTIRHGDTGGNHYVKETRPKLARLSTYGALAYVFVFQGVAVAGQGGGVDWAVLSAIYSPALAYMGMRTVDAFSRKNL